MPNPTRTNLLALKKKLTIAQKGHDILSRKREALVNEFLKLLSQPRKRRQDLIMLLQKGYKTIIISNAYIGNFELQQLAFYMKEASPVGIEIKNVMGVRVPEISEVRFEPTAQVPFGASLAVDEANEEFSKALQALVDTAELEHGLRVVVLEIEKTKKQINTLDNIVIPNLLKSEKYIEMRIDEMEREMFIALKHVKSRLENAR